MIHAFPEDELRPLSCDPLTRDRADSSNIGLNDPLGNYSLTLVDSLSTLAVLASSSQSAKSRRRAFVEFKNGVEILVAAYGDGSSGAGGLGARAQGFDLDSKVQVFETVIRALGGLLSAHLFAVGELPITDYHPHWDSRNYSKNGQAIKWSKNFSYDGQLLRLAHDLGERLLPAFETATGLPYPRVNLRHGIPFYPNAPANARVKFESDEAGNSEQCPVLPNSSEVTETCTAGAGSLVLELTVLSRLTGDPRFEEAGKRAFWSVWERRSPIGLLGSGIDAETGHWTGPFAGLGAGVDSFFEYAFKTYVLLSGSREPRRSSETLPRKASVFDPPPLSSVHHDPQSYLGVWKEAHDALRRHLYRGKNFIHPHYIQGDLQTGAARAFWMDSLSAFFPGLLSIAGETEEAISLHLLFTALWTRYSAIPERWSTATGKVEGGLGWWGGRPEFIESTYHIYKATEDPWYVHVGEMALRDIKRRCWTPCGWSGIQDVRTGERSNRMESFFLGETAKYLHLLFDPSHPLNKLDAPFVFTTEGHPLMIPKSLRNLDANRSRTVRDDQLATTHGQSSCPVRPEPVALSFSSTASRPDLFHAANLARLHQMPTRAPRDSPIVEYSADHPSISASDIQSPSNFTLFPWTLPLHYLPEKGTCELIIMKPTFDITFPSFSMDNTMLAGSLQRVGSGILVTGMGNLRLGMIQDVPNTDTSSKFGEVYRVYAVNNVPLGMDEKIYVHQDAISGVVNPLDPNFTRVRHPVMLDILIDVNEFPTEAQASNGTDEAVSGAEAHSHAKVAVDSHDSEDVDLPSHLSNGLSFLAQHMSSLMHDPPAAAPASTLRRIKLPAITPTGPGAAPVPDVADALGPDAAGLARGPLPYTTILAVGDACRGPLDPRVPRDHHVLVVKRGGCSFAEKLANIPSFPPAPAALQLVIVVSDPEEDAAATEASLVRPLLEEAQWTPSGIPRFHPIPLVMIGGGEAMYRTLEKAKSLGLKRRYSVRAQGVPISNLIIL